MSSQLPWVKLTPNIRSKVSFLLAHLNDVMPVRSMNWALRPTVTAVPARTCFGSWYKTRAGRSASLTDQKAPLLSVAWVPKRCMAMSGVVSSSLAIQILMALMVAGTVSLCLTLLEKQVPAEVKKGLLWEWSRDYLPSTISVIGVICQTYIEQGVATVTKYFFLQWWAPGEGESTVIVAKE